ncbi:MAG: hypothetical protein ABFS41_15690 [Myxococcota bacterium]
MTARKPPSKLFPAALLGAALLLPAPVLAGGEGEPTPPPVSAAPPPAPRALAPTACKSDAPIGQVIAFTGTAEAAAPGQAPRALGCDDPVACEEIVTSADGSLAFLSGDVLVHVGPDARVGLDGSEGAPELFVHQGSVRTTDARSADAAPTRLSARDLSASAAGADLELTTADAAASQVCAFDGEASVDAGPSASTLRAGECFAADAGALATTAAAGPTVGVGNPGICGYAVALDDHLTPGDVAAPGLFSFPAFAPAGDLVRDPCDDPGSGCLGRNPVPFDDPDPTLTCPPGAQC